MADRKRKRLFFSCFGGADAADNSQDEVSTAQQNEKKADARANFLSKLFHRSLSIDGATHQVQAPHARPVPPKPQKMRKLFNYTATNGTANGKGTKKANRLATSIATQKTDSNTAPAALNIERPTTSTLPSSVGTQATTLTETTHPGEAGANNINNNNNPQRVLSTIRESSASMQVSSAQNGGTGATGDDAASKEPASKARLGGVPEQIDLAAAPVAVPAAAAVALPPAAPLSSSEMAGNGHSSAMGHSAVPIAMASAAGGAGGVVARRDDEGLQLATSPPQGGGLGEGLMVGDLDFAMLDDQALWEADNLPDLEALLGPLPPGDPQDPLHPQQQFNGAAHQQALQPPTLQPIAPYGAGAGAGPGSVGAYVPQGVNVAAFSYYPPLSQGPVPPAQQPTGPQVVAVPVPAREGQVTVPVDFVRNARRPKPGPGEVRTCTKCGTSETPQWRAGPHGPGTLCNACGVAWRKHVKKHAAASGGGAGGDS